MPYTMAGFRRDYVKEHLPDLTPAERLEGLPLEEILKAVPPEERLKGLSAEEIERYLQRLRAKNFSKDTPASSDQSS
jgi:hypothetical protein